MINYNKIILLKGVHVLLWTQLIVYVGLNLYTHYTFVSEQIELSEKSDKLPSDINGNCIGEEESEIKQLSISCQYESAVNSSEFKTENSKKVICDYLFHYASNPKEILTPPPQV